MDEMKTPCKRIKLDLEADVEADYIETDDISDVIKRKRIRLEVISGQKEETTVKEKHILNDVLRKEISTCPDLGKDEIISRKTDSVLNLQDKRELQDGQFSEEPPPYRNNIERVQSMDLDSTSTTSPKIEQRQKSDSAPDKSGASEQDVPRDSELNHLREFKVLDEVADDEKKDSDENFSDSESERELADGEEKNLDIPDDEIERMLEENLPEDFKGQPKPKPRPYGQRKKLVLEEKGINHFEVLPLDWIVVRHMSGMPIYLHRPTRVCTFAKPYFLGKASARKHEIPISAIPCLNYRRALEEEKKQNEVDSTNAVDLTNETDIPKSDTTIVNGETGNAISEESSLSQCPFAQEQNNSNSEFDSQDNTDFKVNTNSNNSSENNSRHNFNENSNVLLNGDVGDSNESLSTKIVTLINNDSETNLTPALVTNVADRKMTDDNVAIENKKSDSSENSCNIEGVVDGNTKVSSSTNSIVASSENNVDSIENKTNTGTSDENITNKTNSNTANNDAIAKPVGIAANITVIGNQKVLPGGIILPNVKIETANPENWKNQHLAHEQVTEYCKKLFHFRTINIMRFVQWSERRKYALAKKAMQRPTLPEGTKLITIPAQPAGSGNTALGGRPGQKEWVMNPNGRSYVCIFHEYVQRVLQKKPTYECVQLENAATPYKVTVYLNGMQYGVGYGTSKRQAKSMAAKASIEVLIPEMKDKVTEDSKIDGVACRSDNPDFAFFDFVTIDDPRIAEFCAKTMEPSPHAILHTCLLRNFGVESQEIKYETKPLKRQRIEFTMTVGKHTATVVCKKKKDGKQRAAQAILQALHPHIKSWGSLLRLYGSRSLKSFKEKKIEEQEITLLQGKAMVNTPNYAILNKLKAEMERLRERDTAVVPIGTLIVTDSLPTHSGSNLDNVEI